MGRWKISCGEGRLLQHLLMAAQRNYQSTTICLFDSKKQTDVASESVGDRAVTYQEAEHFL
jgi:hypothetical protein